MITRLRFAAIVPAFSVFVGILHSEEKLGQSDLPTHVTSVNETFLNINNISTVLRNEGISDNDRFGNSGFVFPKGTRKTAIFQSGLLWGGKVGGQVRVGGSMYRTGLRPGKIISPSVAEDPSLYVNRIYRVRSDYLTGDLSSEMADEQKSASEIRAQYALDWAEWPAVRGAPFDDRNNNGVYEPSIDVPGVKDAGQTIWFVCNDLDSAFTLNLFGSRPLGIEMQVTIWGYAVPGPMGDLFFKSYLLINKGLNLVDSMYVCQWSDPDIGNWTDDFAGCDTTLSMGFAFNAYERDATYDPLPPPAAGFRLLQGPLVPSLGNTGRSRGRTRLNFRNLPMTAFFYCGRTSFFDQGTCPNSEVQGSYGDALAYYNLFKGVTWSGQPILDPQGRQTRFMLDGDPVSGTGWVDGQGVPPSDRRIGVSSGPFTMAPGDTQEVIAAEVAALGSDRLSSVTEMKRNARISRSVYDGFFRALPPFLSHSVQFTSLQSTQVKLSADARGTTATSITGVLKRYDGSSAGTLTLYDDGQHDDGAAGDRVFANSVSLMPLAEGIYIDLDVGYTGGYNAMWSRLEEEISTAGPVNATSYAIVSDNINSDGIAQRGENVRFVVTIRNGSQLGFANVALLGPNGRNFLKSNALGNLPRMQTASTVYDPSNPATYFVINIPSSFADAEYVVPLLISDGSHNRWRDSVRIPVFPLAFPVRSTTVAHASGRANGSFDISVVDLTRVKAHMYVIQGIDSLTGTGGPGITLRDSTDGRTLLLNHVLPDTLGHLVPVTDGFKVLRGSIDTSSGMSEWQIPNGTRRWSFVEGNGLGLEGFEGAIGWESPNHYYGFGPRPMSASEVRNVLVKLGEASSSANGNPNNLQLKYGGWNENTVTDTLLSYGYRYLRNATDPPAVPDFIPYIVNPLPGWAYQDYKKGVPFAVYNVEETPPRRLAVGFLENNRSLGLVDGKLWPPPSTAGVANTQTDGPHEWFFIFNRPYTGSTPDFALQTDILNNPLPVMWMGTVTRRGDFDYREGDEFLILAHHPLTSQDRYVFSLDSIIQNFVPSGFQLRQNYPNPFNPNTTIAYDLPVASRVVIKIYNILGQYVKLLLDEAQQLGFNSTVWDAMNSEGNQVSTGVYFYRVEATSLADPSRSFTQVKKMMVLR